MLSKYYYTDKEKETLIKSIVILVDTREKKGNHITDWFDKKGISWKKKSLEYGDYSFLVSANPELGIFKDLDFSSEIIVERKASLEELSNNLTKERSRFEKELTLAPKNKVLLIENANYSDIIEGNYDTQYNKKSYWGTIHSFWHRYGMSVFFMPDNKYSGVFIKGYFEYFLKDYLK